MIYEQVTHIVEAIETLTKETDVEGKEIIDLLTGFCWDEEDGFRIKRQLLGEEDDDVCSAVERWIFQYDCKCTGVGKEYLEGYQECQTVLEEGLQ